MKRCEDCAHFKLGEGMGKRDNLHYAQCRRVAVPSPISEKFDSFTSCHLIRKWPDHCGPDGKWWIARDAASEAPKPTSWQRLFGG